MDMPVENRVDPINRGRLPFSNLLRMSCLTGNSVRTALIVLIQQTIPEEILTRIRFGQYINIAYGRFGIESKLIVECLLDNGKLRVGQLVTLVCDQYLHSQSRQKFDLDTDNLYDLSPLKLPQIVKSNVFNLLAERYIRPAHPKHTINPTDLALAYENIFEQESLRSFNLEAGLVMRAMLILAESKQKIVVILSPLPKSHTLTEARSFVARFRSDLSAINFNELGSQSNIVKTCFPTRAANGQFNLKLKNTGDLVAEMLSVMAKQDDLATSTTSVYTPGSGGSGSGGMREFKIEYARFSLELRKTLVARIIREKFGIEAARVVRILMHKGRLDEKHLAKFAMMTLKDSRELCLKLSAGKVIELQKYRKQMIDNLVEHSTYFYRFPKLILNLTIMIRKSQTNLIIRIDQELKLKKTLISKINRSDVIHDQDGLLTVWERADIKKLNTLIQVLEVAKLRLERDLFILNDLPWLQ
ncbi:hypothetical protein KEM48_012196 [Puccinia striiformis f. sp. tritici PST-130]|nr:hypothetical protein KEM48_012196 [Puccinia striiformis f. sp. tritici PST-130]